MEWTKRNYGTGFGSNHIFLVNSENKATNVDHRLTYKVLQNNRRISFL